MKRALDLLALSGAGLVVVGLLALYASQAVCIPVAGPGGSTPVKTPAKAQPRQDITVYVFSQKTCEPCVRLKANILELQRKKRVPAGVRFEMLYTETDAALTRKYGVTATPTLVALNPKVFYEPQKKVGYLTEDELAAWLNYLETGKEQ